MTERMRDDHRVTTAPERAPTNEQRRLATIMFTDMVNYSALTQKNEALALELLDEHRRLLRGVFAGHGGREVETVGDAFFVEFPSALAGAQCAVEIQRVLFERNAGVPPDRAVHVRIGLHLGDVVARGPSVHGDGVNIAARIEPLADPGGILLSEDVARQIRNKLDLPLRSRGRASLKNIEVSVKVYEILLPWARRRFRLSGLPAFDLGRRTLRWGALGALSVVILSGAYLARWSFVPSIDVTRYRVVVLPFANLTGDPDNEYFADGVTEELISSLSRISGLRVIARTTSMQYKATRRDVADIGRKLQVGTVLEGSVRRAGDKVRITVQLIDVASQEHLWSEDYDRELRDVFAIQSDISQRVAQALQVQLMAEDRRRLGAHHTESVEAYTAYLKGRYHWNRRTHDGFQKAIQYFGEAIARDPRDALAYAGLADAHTLDGWYGFVRPTEAFPRATAAAEKALDLDPELAEAHTSLAAIRMVYDWDWAAAEREFTRALALNNRYATARAWYGWLLAATGRVDESIAEERRAQELDPLSLIINTAVGNTLYFARRYDQAIEQFRKTLALDPSFGVAHRFLGLSYLGKGLRKDAVDEARLALELAGRQPLRVGNFGYVLAVAGRREEARRLLDELRGRSGSEYVPAIALAWIHLGLGEHDRAIEWLEHAYDERSAELIFSGIYPIYDSIRGDARFRRLLGRLGLPSTGRAPAQSASVLSSLDVATARDAGPAGSVAGAQSVLAVRRPGR